MKNKRILITGICGLHGANLAKRLLEKDYDVVGLNTWSERSENVIKKFELEKAQIVWGSITDSQIVEKTMRNIDIVVNAAALHHVDLSIKNPRKFFEVNVLGTNNILEECKKKNIPLLHISSCEVYGFQNNLLTENSPFKANSPYAASKAGADIECYSYWKTFGVDITIVRPANVFGRNQKTGKDGSVISIWVEKLLSGENIQIYGSGEQSREFIYVEDLVDVYEMLIEKKLEKEHTYAGEIFNIGSDEQISMNDLASLILSNIPNSNGLKIEHTEGRLGEVNQFTLCSQKIMRTLNWKPKISIEDGIKKYISWVQGV